MLQKLPFMSKNKFQILGSTAVIRCSMFKKAFTGSVQLSGVPQGSANQVSLLKSWKRTWHGQEG